MRERVSLSKAFRLTVLCGAVLAVGLRSTQASGPANVTFTTVDFPGAVDTSVLRSNAAGHLVGSYTDANGYIHGFVFRKGVYTTIDPPDALATTVLSINNRGQMVGFYVSLSSGDCHGFLFDNGTFTDIDYPGAASTLAFDINDGGQIVGQHWNEPGCMISTPMHGFLLDKGQFTTIDVPGAGSVSRTLGINNKGQIVGSHDDVAGACHGFLLDKGQFSAIDVPGAETLVVGINETGDVVGGYGSRIELCSSAHVPFHGFVLRKGAYTNIDIPGAIRTEPSGINGGALVVGARVVGSYQEANGHFHGFVIRY